MAEKDISTKNTGVLAKVSKPHGKYSWRNFFGVFSKASEGSVASGPSSISKSEDRLDCKRSHKKDKEDAKNKVGFKDQPSSSKSADDPLALKVTLPSNLSNSDLSVSFEIESTEGKMKMKHKKKDKGKMYLTCIRKTEKLSEFEGQLILPPETDINKLAKMPLYFVDTDGNPLKSNYDDYTVFQPVKNTLSKNVDIGMKIKDVHLKVKLEKLNLSEKQQKIPKYLSCSFVNANQCPPPPDPRLIFDDDFDFYDDDDEVEEEVQEPKKKLVKGVSTDSSEKIVADLLHNVMSTIPLKKPSSANNCERNDYVHKKESADSVLPRSSCTSMVYSDVCSFCVDSVPQNSPNDRIIQTKVRHEPPSQGDDYYDLNKQLEDDECELLEHQRRVEELDRTLELLQNARTKLTSFLAPGDVVQNINDPGKVYQLLPLAGLPPVSYLCAAQSPGNSNLSVEAANPMEMVYTREDSSEGTSDGPAPPIAQCTSLTHCDNALADKPSILIVHAQTKLEDELQRFREKDKSKSNIEIISQHKYLRSIAAVTPKMKLNTIQNLYFSPRFTVEFDAAAYEGLNALYDKRYGSKNSQSIASRENDLAYSIVENDIKSMIHDLLKETWNIKETVLENYGKVRNDDDLISLMEHDLAERESFTNSAFFADHRHGENNSTNGEVWAAKEDTSTDFSATLSAVAIPYQVNYCIINNPQKSPMVTVNRLNPYHDIVPDDTSKGKLEISSGMTNLFDEINQCNQVQVSADDNISDKKDSGTNETFESQYSKGYNVLVAEMPIDRARTKFILNTAQIQDLRDDEESINDDLESEQDAPQQSSASMSSRITLKSPKFADINATKNICETDTDFAETEINTVYASTAEVVKISALNSDSICGRVLFTQRLPHSQFICDNNEDETVIKETDLTKKNVSIPMLKYKLDEKISQHLVTEKKSITMSQFSQKSKYSARSRSTARHCVSTSSTSEDFTTTKATQTIVTLKKAVSIASDSDSEGIRIVQPNPLEDSDSHIPLQLKMPHQQISPIPGTSRLIDNEIESFISTTSRRSTTSEDYEADTDENFTISLPNLKYKHTSVEELNTQDEIDKIELNVQENNKLYESQNKIMIRTDVSYELNMDDSSSFMSTQSSLLLSEEEVEPTFIKNGDSEVSLQ